MADGIGDGVGRNYVGMYQVLGKFQRPRFPRICEENLAGKEIAISILSHMGILASYGRGRGDASWAMHNFQKMLRRCSEFLRRSRL